jgi:hypothetical protein
MVAVALAWTSGRTHVDINFSHVHQNLGQRDNLTNPNWGMVITYNLRDFKVMNKGKNQNQNKRVFGCSHIKVIISYKLIDEGMRLLLNFGKNGMRLMHMGDVRWVGACIYHMSHDIIAYDLYHAS